MQYDASSDNRRDRIPLEGVRKWQRASFSTLIHTLPSLRPSFARLARFSNSSSLMALLSKRFLPAFTRLWYLYVGRANAPTEVARDQSWIRSSPRAFIPCKPFFKHSVVAVPLKTIVEIRFKSAAIVVLLKRND